MRKFEIQFQLHPVGTADPEKTEAGLKRAGAEFAEGETARPQRFFGFQYRAGFEEGMESARQLQKVVGEEIWTMVLENDGEDLAEACDESCEMDFLGFLKNDAGSLDIEVAIQLPEDGTDADV